MQLVVINSKEDLLTLEEGSQIHLYLKKDYANFLETIPPRANIQTITLDLEEEGLNMVQIQQILERYPYRFELKKYFLQLSSPLISYQPLVEEDNLLSLYYYQNLYSIVFKFNINNALSPQNCYQLGLQLQKFRHLHNLTLQIQQFNDLGEMGLRNISDGIKQLSQLKEFSIQFGPINIGPQGAQCISDAIQNMNNLEVLDIFIGTGNYILSEGAIALSNGIKKLQKLKKLQFVIGYQNDIQNTGIIALTDSFQFLTNLTELHLVIWCFNNMGMDGGLQAMKNIVKLTKLEIFELFLTYSHITPIMFQQFPCYNQLINLKSFKITIWPGNYNSDMGAISFYESLSSFENLEELHLSIQSVCIGQNGAISIGQGLQKLCKLKKLTLIIRPNQIDDGGLNGIIQGLQSLSISAIRLEIDTNNISQMKAFELCETIAFLPQIEQCSIQIKEAKFNPKELVNEISQTRKRSFEVVNEQMDQKTAYYAGFFNQDLAITMAMPNQ
ncbi:hypothetical protein pb186bvf_001623 [Paramecium bursaria]